MLKSVQRNATWKLGGGRTLQENQVWKHYAESSLWEDVEVMSLNNDKVDMKVHRRKSVGEIPQTVKAKVSSEGWKPTR